VKVPEAAMYQDNLVVAGKDNVGLTGMVFDMEPEPKAHLEDNLSDQDLWLGVCRPDAAHIGRAPR